MKENKKAFTLAEVLKKFPRPFGERVRVRGYKAFTLAEVLITLGIIGVVSAMTLPSVINNYKEREIVSKVKKFYSIMNQAFLMSVKDNGYANEWEVVNGQNKTSTRQIAKYFKPYLKIIKDCGQTAGCLEYTDRPFTLNSGKTNVNYDASNLYYKAILNDGSYVWWRGVAGTYCKVSEGGHNDVCGAIFFDINGGKEPNTVGKDIFDIVITPYAIKPNIDDNCKKNSTGWGCSGYILKNGNMDYLK